MRAYIELIKTVFKANLAYRVNYFFGLAGHILWLIIWVAVWRALLGASGETATDTGTVTIRDMITYVVISRTISVLITQVIIDVMDERIRTGQISMDLIKPINFQAFMFCHVTGNSLFQFLFQLLPVFGIGALCFGIQYPSAQNFLLFCISVVNAAAINFLITYIIGLLGFQILSIWVFRRFIGDLISLFSGSYIPLWFFPNFLISISLYLPFRLIYFMPISIYLNKLEVVDSLWIILLQLLWIVMLYGFTQLLWRLMVRRLVIQGG